MSRYRTAGTVAAVTIAIAVLATVGSFVLNDRCAEIHRELETIRAESLSVKIARRELDGSSQPKYPPGTDLSVELDKDAVSRVIDVVSAAGVRNCQRFSPDVALSAGDIAVWIDFASSSNGHAAQLLIFGDHAYLWSRTTPNRAWEWSVQHDVRDRLRSMIGDAE